MQPHPAPWPARRIALWALVAALAVAWQGRGWLRDLRPPADIVVDFYQEWASARNWLCGAPIYEPQRTSCLRYLGCTPQGDAPHFIEINAHPPTAVLLGLPLAGLNYPAAVFLWNLFSLAALAVSVWLIARNLGFKVSPWAALPLLSLTLVCWPLRSDLQQGQLALVLLLLIVGAWTADRSGHEMAAGLMLGAAATLKLYPAFLFLYFAFRRQWRVVGAGIACMLVLTAGTLALLGPAAYIAYFREVPPLAGEWRSAWNNASLPGLWSKLFDPGTKGCGVEPLCQSSALAHSLDVLSCLTIVILLGRTTQRAQTRVECEHAFAATVVGMLLLAPVTWEHSFVLLLLPFGILWPALSFRSVSGRVFVLLAVLLLINPTILYRLCRLGAEQPAGRIYTSAAQAVIVLSVQCYALLGLFVMALRLDFARRAAVEGRLRLATAPQRAAA